MKHSRTAAALVAALALSAATTACGDDEESPGAANASSGQADKKKVSIGVVMTLTGVKFAQDTKTGVEAAAEELGPIELDINGPPSIDPVLAQKQATDMLAKRPDAMGISPFPPEVWQRTLKTATEQADHVVTYNAKPVGTAKDVGKEPVATFVGINDTQLARDLLTATIEKAGLGPETTGTVLLGQCVAGNSGVLYERIQGFKQVLAEKLPKATPKVFDSKVEPQANTTTWEQTLKANPDPALAIGTCDQDGTSLYKIKKASGADFPAGAVETPPETIRGVKDGTILASAAVNWWLEGYTTIRLLAESARGERAIPKGFVDVGYTMIDKDNVAEIEQRDASPEAAAAWYRPKVEEFFGNLEANVKPLADAWK